MKTVALGDSGEKVSALCLGAMNFGTKLDEPRSMELLDRYWEAGGRFIDTANNYAFWWGGDGTESENVLGRWMRLRKNRNELFLATKVGFNTPKVGNGLSRSVIRREIEGSLRRLGTDRIDLYYAHKDHRSDPLVETLAAFDELHRQGKIRLIGCSNHRAWRIEEARTLSRKNGWLAYCCVQQRHTYLRPVAGARFDPQLVVDDELCDYCAAHAKDFLLLGYSSTLGGAYNRRPDRPIPPQYRGPANEARLATLSEVAREVGATPLQLVYAWMLNSTPLALPLVSAGSMQQLDENLGALKVALDAPRMKRLDEAGDPLEH
ncbi:MAG: aldo/keto reductase [Spirochaetes bacterium]|nr:aldo/keto reductase [Spirochaetota bacterium]